MHGSRENGADMGRIAADGRQRRRCDPASEARNTGLASTVSPCRRMFPRAPSDNIGSLAGHQEMT